MSAISTFEPKQRGEQPHPDDWLSDEELRERAVLSLQTAKLSANAAARKLAIMQENKALVESANAITKDRK